MKKSVFNLVESSGNDIYRKARERLLSRNMGRQDDLYTLLDATREFTGCQNVDGLHRSCADKAKDIP